MKVTITKTTGGNEISSFEFSVNDEKDMGKLVNAYRMADARMVELNERYLRNLKLLELFPARWRGALRAFCDAVYHDQPDFHEKVPGLIPKEDVEEAKADGA